MKPTLLSRWKQFSTLTKALLLALPLVLVLAVVKSSAPPQPLPSGLVDNSTGKPIAKPRVDLASYNQLVSGMSYVEATRILGSSGTEMSSSDLGGTHTVMYKWEAGMGANMNAMFQNGQLVSKAQFGLR